MVNVFVRVCVSLALRSRVKIFIHKLLVHSEIPVNVLTLYAILFEKTLRHSK